MPELPAHRSSSPRFAHRFFTMSAAVVTFAALGAAACGEGSSDPESASGSELYAANCASCHGTDLRGTDQGPSALSIVYEPSHHGDDSFRAAIELGTRQHHWTFGDMAPIDGLDDDEVDAIIAFVRAEQERSGFEQYPP